MMIKHKTENNMSSSGLTRRSRNKDLRADWIPDQVGDDRRVESGRSMVEMLGTLAIIGVLSVGSIAGYRYAMDNYYTNEILAGASQRAVLVAAQIASGREASLKEFDKIETAGGTFGKEVKTDIEGEFGIIVTGVKESVCKNILKATEGTDAVLAKIDGSDFTEENCSAGEFRITYSNDLGKGGEGQGGALCEGVTCSGCQTCNPSDGSCVDDNSKCDTGETCLIGKCLSTECKHEDCTCETAGLDTNCPISAPYCQMGFCITSNAGTYCSSNAVCAGTDAPYCVNEFCALSAEGMSCTSSSTCAETDAPYCSAEMQCVKTMKGAVCFSDSNCVGSDAPYCHPTAGVCTDSL